MASSDPRADMIATLQRELEIAQQQILQFEQERARLVGMISSVNSASQQLQDEMRLMASRSARVVKATIVQNGGLGRVHLPFSALVQADEYVLEKVTKEDPEWLDAGDQDLVMKLRPCTAEELERMRKLANQANAVEKRLGEQDAGQAEGEETPETGP